MKLLLNADDLGFTPTINQAIFGLHSRGRLSSTSLLVNILHIENAMDGLLNHSDLEVGVHLNLTKGRPILPPEKTTSLVSGSGEFWPTKQFYVQAFTSRVKLYDIEDELRAQIEFALDSGIQPTHLDSHSHWHLLPHLRKLVTQLAKDYQLSGIRQFTPRRTLLPSHLWLSIASRRTQQHSQFSIPDYLLSLHQWIGSNGQPIDLFFSEQLKNLISRPNITLELVTHPGALQDPDFPADTLLTHQRQWEYDFLCSSRFDEWINLMDAEIINYQAL